MNCHIVPMAYLRSWSTDETYSAERKKRKIYVSKKGKVPIKSQIIKTENDDYEFITSDFPICNNNSGRIDEGLYFPINRNACLFLVKGKHDDNLKVIEASSEVIQFVNHLMRKAAKKILISSVPLTEDDFLETCPEEEFRKILGVE